jgi:conjugative transfer signal peptidase TraF
MIGRSAVLAAMVMAIAAIGATAGSGGSGTTLRFVWNASASVSTGLYRVRPARDLTVTTLVVAYPPEPLATWLADGRYLPRGLPLLKPILALGGQTVCRAGPVITIDGRKRGAAREQHHRGRPLPVWQGCRVIGNGEIFLMNPDEPVSLDGRYFGPIPSATIGGLAEPLWTSMRLRRLPDAGQQPRSPAFRPCCARSDNVSLPSVSSTLEVNTNGPPTLIAACALTVDPKIMHALIWHQSGGEPWLFSVSGQRQPQVLRSMGDAIGAARGTQPDDVAIRVGLAGLPGTPRAVTATMFAPAPTSSRPHARSLSLRRCAGPLLARRATRYCAVAAWHGSLGAAR